MCICHTYTVYLCCLSFEISGDLINSSTKHKGNVKNVLEKVKMKVEG